jgi:peptidoglycan/xylan/chitin deacetylase (PgdA/CDA1 family)
MGIMKSMVQRYLVLAVIVLGAFIADSLSVRAQTKDVAVTIDDLPLNGPNIGITRLRLMTDNLLSGLAKNQVPGVGFVNESLLYVTGETDARIEILKSWSDRGFELGDHTFSHMGFKTASLSEFEDDFLHGEAVTRMLLKQKGQKPRFFRHPFLQMGNTFEIEKSFENFIGERGYRIAPVTIDSMDWMFLAAYAKAKTENDAKTMRLVADEYIKFAGLKFDYCEAAAREIAGRNIKHILLLHANELNADNVDRLVKVIREHGYRFITLEQALTDPFYQFPQKYQSTSDWLSLWAFDKGKKLDPPSPPEFIQKAYADAQTKAVSANR